MTRERLIKISKLISYALRHKPEKLGITVDAAGWADFARLMEGLRRFHPWVTEQFVRDMIARSDRQRFELRGEKIRATYGHSIDVEMEGEAVEPPEELYHGTSRETAKEIKRHGIKPMGRQYVHLSITKEEASLVGRRKDTEPVILTIMAREAHREGIAFYRSGPVYLAKNIPSAFIKDDT